MKLLEWANRNSVTYRTAWEHFRRGLIPGAYKLPTGTIVIPEEITEATVPEITAVYARVSSSENKPNLETQVTRVVEFCRAKGWVVNQIHKECASGLNDKRPKLLKVLSDPDVTRVVVEHKDRLTRFGYEYIKLLSDKEIVVVNQAVEDEEDLMQDFVSIVTSFCARLYGRRRSRRKTEKLIKEMQYEDN